MVQNKHALHVDDHSAIWKIVPPQQNNEEEPQIDPPPHSKRPHAPQNVQRRTIDKITIGKTKQEITMMRQHKQSRIVTDNPIESGAATITTDVSRALQIDFVSVRPRQEKYWHSVPL